MTDLFGFSRRNEWVTNYDGDGRPLTGIIELDGEYHIGVDGCRERITEADAFEARDDDVYIVGYQKSGAHWTYDIIEMVMRGSSDIGLANKDKNFYEITPFSAMAAVPSPRVIDTHLPLHRIPRDILARKCKIVLNIRNPKDVMVSFYHHVTSMGHYGYNGSIAGYCKLYLEGKGESGSWFDNVLPLYEYSKTHPEVLVLKYEDMIKDLPAAVRKVADHLERPLSDALCQEIARQCDFAAMKQRKRENGQDGLPGMFKDESGTFYRKGMVGDWKNWFTVKMNEEFDNHFNDKMKTTDLEVDFEI